MSPAATKRFWEAERGERAKTATLRASPMPDGSIVIQGTLPDGKYLVLEVHGKKVKVAFFGAPAEPLWSCGYEKQFGGIWTLSLSLKRWKKDQPRWIPQEVLDCLKSEWGVKDA